MHTYDSIFSTKQHILIVTAHPDDSVVFFGALMHRLCSDGKTVTVLVATNGARGSRENTISEKELGELRLNEERNALQKLGVPNDHVLCLEYPDGEMESSLPLIGQIAKVIRQCKADIVCTHEPSMQYLHTYDKSGYFIQHRDHRKVGEAVLDAVYPFSRDRSFFPEHAREGIDPHSVYDVLLTDERDCNFDFDCESHTEAKRAAMLEHTSQFDEAKVDEILEFMKFEGKTLEKFHYLNLQW